MIKIWLSKIPGLVGILIGGFGILLVISIIRDIRHPDEDEEKKNSLQIGDEVAPSQTESPDNINLGI